MLGCSGNILMEVTSLSVCYHLTITQQHIGPNKELCPVEDDTEHPNSWSSLSTETKN